MKHIRTTSFVFHQNTIITPSPANANTRTCADAEIFANLIAKDLNFPIIFLQTSPFKHSKQIDLIELRELFNNFQSNLGWIGLPSFGGI